MEPTTEDYSEDSELDEYGELDKLIKGYWMVINLLEVEQPKQDSVIKYLRKRLDKIIRGRNIKYGKPDGSNGGCTRGASAEKDCSNTTRDGCADEIAGVDNV